MQNVCNRVSCTTLLILLFGQCNFTFLSKIDIDQIMTVMLSLIRFPHRLSKWFSICSVEHTHCNDVTSFLVIGNIPVPFSALPSKATLSVSECVTTSKSCPVYSSLWQLAIYSEDSLTRAPHRI